MELIDQPIKVSKMKWTYNGPSSAISVQWIAFKTLSLPYLALKDLGYIFLAISGSYGPQRALNC